MTVAEATKKFLYMMRSIILQEKYAAQRRVQMNNVIAFNEERQRHAIANGWKHISERNSEQQKQKEEQ
jgi:hypothetical protein